VLSGKLYTDVSGGTLCSHLHVYSEFGGSDYVHIVVFSVMTLCYRLAGCVPTFRKNVLPRYSLLTYIDTMLCYVS
jgi:hypothetical protein